MTLIKPFNHIGKGDAAIAGGKGASLGEMTQAGIPVPPGFVILSPVFDSFLAEADLIQEVESILGTVKHEQMHTIESASERIQSLILNASVPVNVRSEIEGNFKKLDATFVAVRSSATAEDGADHAWAGQLDSYLNTTEATLLEKVQRCWASLFTPRAIFYRFEKGLRATDISVAVVVQKMVEAEISGIAFSVHPVTEDRNQLIIEAGFGLGEAIVSGQVTPDSYVVEKEPRKILDKNIYTQTRGIYRAEGGGNEWREIAESLASSQVLSDEQVLELSALILQIENHYGFPCDIEWALEKGEFYILQSRPITTLRQDEITPAKEEYYKAYTRDFSIIMQEAWFHANRDEFNKRLELSSYPPGPPYIYFMRDGVEEVWENKKANEWLYEQLSKRIESDPEFFPSLYKSYFDKLDRIRQWFQKDIQTTSDLKLFLDEVYTATADFVLMYGATLSESLEPEQQKLANEFRESDTFFADCNTALEKSLNTIYPDFGPNVVYITREELSTPISRSQLAERSHGFALIPGIFKGAISFDALKDKFPEYHFVAEEFDLNAVEVAGQPAYQGKVTGMVRILKRKDQVNLVHEGEIIVSPMTTPEMISGMKRAAAFVTDEGGITCHAAIIAREMRKPCIIGTKVASSIFADGDIVEVDAMTGVVRLVSRYGYRTQVPDWKAEDFVLTFAASGVTPLFQESGTRCYMPADTFQLAQKGHTRDFASISTIERLNAEGAEVYATVQATQLLVDDMDRALNAAEQLFNGDFSDLSIELLERSFAVMDAVHEAYRIFDSAYTDGAYTSAGKMTPALELVEKSKNLFRDRYSELFFSQEGGLVRLLGAIAETRNCAINDLCWCLRSEVVDVFHGAPVPIERINERKEGYAFIKSSEGITFVQGPRALEFIKRFGNSGETQDGIIRGITASGGSAVTGTVAIINSNYADIAGVRKRMSRMEQGEILVSVTTAPDLMEACKKAAAIVTDLGGMLSHAAITARELGIPCIIGTGNASRELNDGDLIEVDPETGEIRILSTVPSPDEYVRMFSNKSFFYLYTDIFLGYYKSLGVVCVQDDDTWISLLPKEMREKTLREGAELYTSSERYKDYKDTFQEYRESSTRYFETQLQKHSYTRDELQEFFATAYRHFSFYSKTEFFYTDHINQSKMIPSIQEFDELKMTGRSYLNKVLFESYVPELIRKLSNYYSIPAEELFKYSMAEILTVSEGGPALSREEIQQRDTLFAQGEEAIFGDDAVDQVQAFLSPYRELSNIIKGTTAYGGKVRGKARVLVPDFSNFSATAAAVEEMQYGEILVTETTAPEVIAACKKAAAIITNQGGMLSHAAIVARELKIPCIIGTDKDIVLNIQTGDELEIDADAGTIHIIK